MGIAAFDTSSWPSTANTSPSTGWQAHEDRRHRERDLEKVLLHHTTRRFCPSRARSLGARLLGERSGPQVVADITYVPTWSGSLFRAVVMTASTTSSSSHNAIWRLSSPSTSGITTKPGPTAASISTNRSPAWSSPSPTARSSVVMSSVASSTSTSALPDPPHGDGLTHLMVTVDDGISTLSSHFVTAWISQSPISVPGRWDPHTVIGSDVRVETTGRHRLNCTLHA